jgi:2-amino-4-hydroxy-6-hydroxymethyldihydropteridine diphosphokinase
MSLSNMAAVYVAIGSNVDAERNVAKAKGELKRIFPDTRFSTCYRNRAVGFEGDDFVNCVAGFTTDLSVHQVIEQLQAIEILCDRPRDAPRWAPRTMDLDILLYDSLVCSEPKLKLPRPDLLKRAFMLGPMAEIAPEVVHPTEAVTIGELWQRFDRAAHPMEPVTLTSQHSDRRPQPEFDQ